MPLQLGSRTAVLTGIVTIDETESLAGWLRTRGSAQTPARVHLGACTHLHTAALQALLAASVQVSVAPADPFLRTWLSPLLEQAPAKAVVPGIDAGLPLPTADVDSDSDDSDDSDEEGSDEEDSEDAA